MPSPAEAKGISSITPHHQPAADRYTFAGRNIKTWAGQGHRPFSGAAGTELNDSHFSRQSVRQIEFYRPQEGLAGKNEWE
jgi:hypothetical protein